MRYVRIIDQSQRYICVALLFPSVLLSYEGWTLVRGRDGNIYQGNERLEL